jgi:hypothetical protein
VPQSVGNGQPVSSAPIANGYGVSAPQQVDDRRNGSIVAYNGGIDNNRAPVQQISNNGIVAPQSVGNGQPVNGELIGGYGPQDDMSAEVDRRENQPIQETDLVGMQYANEAQAYPHQAKTAQRASIPHEAPLLESLESPDEFSRKQTRTTANQREQLDDVYDQPAQQQVDVEQQARSYPTESQIASHETVTKQAPSTKQKKQKQKTSKKKKDPGSVSATDQAADVRIMNSSSEAGTADEDAKKIRIINPATEEWYEMDTAAFDGIAQKIDPEESGKSAKKNIAR